MKQKKYIIVNISLITLYNIFMIFIVILPVYEKYGNFKIPGNPMDIIIIISSTGQIRTAFPLIIYIITLMNYLFVGILTKFITGTVCRPKIIIIFRVAKMARLGPKDRVGPKIFSPKDSYGPKKMSRKKYVKYCTSKINTNPNPNLVYL
uniref:Uncharacterized protein n=1 Tax=Meloidogyne enterolobii TaxID=390850 RepID=A0A6V7WN03_MELEN|nr:unnamed protein product [Meloidogyne enterolobii]